MGLDGNLQHIALMFLAMATSALGSAASSKSKLNRVEIGNIPFLNQSTHGLRRGTVAGTETEIARQPTKILTSCTCTVDEQKTAKAHMLPADAGVAIRTCKPRQSTNLPSGRGGF